MQGRSLLILAGVVLVLAGFIVFYEKDLPSTDELAELETKVLRLEEGDIRAVTIRTPDQTVRLERVEEDEADEAGDEADDTSFAAIPESAWRIAEPLAARADASAVDLLVRAIVGLEKKRTIEAPDRQALGLESAETTLTLVTDDGETVLALGVELPASGDRVLGVEGRDEAYQVASTALADIDKEAGEWRDKRVFDGARSEIERLSLETGEQKVLLGRRGERFWIEAPITDRAHRGSVDGVLTQVTGLRVESFIDEPPADLAELGLAPPLATLEAVLEDREAPFRLEIGAPVENEEGLRFGRADGQLFQVRTELMEALERPPTEWRSREWSGLEVYQIDRVELQQDGETLTLERDGADWRRDGERVGYSSASDLLYALADAEAERLLSPDEAAAEGLDLSTPWLEIALVDEDGATETLRLAEAADSGAAASTGGREVILWLPTAAVDEIAAKLDALRAAEVLPEEEDEEVDEEDAEPEDEDATGLEAEPGTDDGPAAEDEGS